MQSSSESFIEEKESRRMRKAQITFGDRRRDTGGGQGTDGLEGNPFNIYHFLTGIQDYGM